MNSVNILKNLMEKIRKLYRYIYNIVFSRIYKRNKLIILDDTFPNMFSGFRIAEYNYLLRYYENAVIYTTQSQIDDKYVDIYPELCNKISVEPNLHNRYKLIVSRDFDIEKSVFYIMFLHNAKIFLPVIEYFKIPFIFEIYTGGVFCFDDEESDKILREVLSSKYLYKIFVNYQQTRNYLLKHKMVSEDKIAMTKGCITQVEYWEKNIQTKQKYKQGKNTFDIAFIAHRYSEKGEQKGYDLFIDIAKILNKKYVDIRFHVVGGHIETDIDVQDLGENIKFYGVKPQDFFPAFYSYIDIMLSLETPSKGCNLSNGNTGGFPTVSAVQSAINGVAVFAKDDLMQNEIAHDGVDIVILENNIKSIIEKIEYYHENLDKLYEIAKIGQKYFTEIYSENYQMPYRTKVIDEIINKNRKEEKK